MQIANCLVSLGGDHGNTVSKFHVTAAEIAVLRAIHGEDSINEVEPIGEVKRSNREERGRLLAIYGAAKSHDQKPIVETMFPGVAARVFEQIHELDLDESFFKATGRLKAPRGAVVEGATLLPGPTIEEWVGAGYPADAYPPSGFTAKSTPEEIAAFMAAHEPAAQTDDDDADKGVGEDINDGIGGEPDKDILG